MAAASSPVVAGVVEDLIETLRKGCSMYEDETKLVDCIKGVLKQYDIEVDDSVLNQYVPIIFKKLTFDGYVPISEIGKGSFGSVILAETMPTPMGKKYSVAVKTFFSRGSGISKSTLVESVAATTISGPNVLPLLDVEIKDSQIQLVFPLAHTDLRNYMKGFFERGEAFTWTEMRSIVHQILTGLAQFEIRNAVHRDVKPANILVTKDGYIMIADFGFTLLNNVMFPQHISGTTAYIAPEVLLDTPYIFSAVDVWAAGIVISQMCTAVQRIPNTGVFNFPEQRDLGKPGTREAFLNAIFSRTGSPSYDFAPSLFQLPNYQLMIDSGELCTLHDVNSVPGIRDFMFQRCSFIPKEAQNVFVRMLNIDPEERPTFFELLSDPIFASLPRPVSGKTVSIFEPLRKNSEPVKKDMNDIVKLFTSRAEFDQNPALSSTLHYMNVLQDSSPMLKRAMVESSLKLFSGQYNPKIVSSSSEGVLELCSKLKFHLGDRTLYSTAWWIYNERRAASESEVDLSVLWLLTAFVTIHSDEFLEVDLHEIATMCVDAFFLSPVRRRITDLISSVDVGTFPVERIMRGLFSEIV